MDTHLLHIGFKHNNVDKAFYTYHKNGKLAAMLSTTVDDFYLSSLNQQIENEFFSYMSSLFDITTPNDTIKIDFLSLRIYKTNLETSVDQTYHIYKNLITGYFDPGHSPKITDTPIRATPTY